MATTSRNGKANTATTADLEAQIAQIRDDINGLTSLLAEVGQNKQEELRAAVTARAEAARDSGKAFADAAQARASDMADQARAHAQSAQSDVENFVRTQPATALGLAAGIGFLVGYLGGRR